MLLWTKKVIKTYHNYAILLIFLAKQKPFFLQQQFNIIVKRLSYRWKYNVYYLSLNRKNVKSFIARLATSFWKVYNLFASTNITFPRKDEMFLNIFFGPYKKKIVINALAYIVNWTMIFVSFNVYEIILPYFSPILR